MICLIDLLMTGSMVNNISILYGLVKKGLGVGAFQPGIRHALLEYYNIPNKKNKNK